MDIPIKKGLIAQERGRMKVRKARHEWKPFRQPRMREESHRIMFIDETATKTNMTRLPGRSPLGERLFGTALFGRWVSKRLLLD